MSKTDNPAEMKRKLRGPVRECKVKPPQPIVKTNRNKIRYKVRFGGFPEFYLNL